MQKTKLLLIPLFTTLLSTMLFSQTYTVKLSPTAAETSKQLVLAHIQGYYDGADFEVTLPFNTYIYPSKGVPYLFVGTKSDQNFLKTISKLKQFGRLNLFEKPVEGVSWQHFFLGTKQLVEDIFHHRLIPLSDILAAGTPLPPASANHSPSLWGFHELTGPHKLKGTTLGVSYEQNMQIGGLPGMAASGRLLWTNAQPNRIIFPQGKFFSFPYWGAFFPMKHGQFAWRHFEQSLPVDRNDEEEKTTAESRKQNIELLTKMLKDLTTLETEQASLKAQQERAELQLGKKIKTPTLVDATAIHSAIAKMLAKEIEQKEQININFSKYLNR